MEETADGESSIAYASPFRIALPSHPRSSRTDHGNRLSPPERTHPAPGVEQPYFLPSHEISDPAVAIRSALVARISERISGFGQGGTEVFVEVRCSA